MRTLAISDRTRVCTRISCVPSGNDLIQDRLVFGATNLKPMLKRRDEWAIEASQWLEKAGRLKRAYQRELEANAVAEARGKRAAASSSAGDVAPPTKKMRVLRDAEAKEKHPGSLAVKAGETCLFHESCTNPTWVEVRAAHVPIQTASEHAMRCVRGACAVCAQVTMLDGISKDKRGRVPVFKLEEIKEEVMADATDSEAEAEAEAQEAAEEAAAEEKPSLEAVESAIQEFYEEHGDMEKTFSVADIDEQLGISKYQEADIKAVIEALCAGGVDGASPPAYKIVEDGKYEVIDK